MATHCEICLRWMHQNLTNANSTWVHVIDWCHQATSHYLNHCWHSSVTHICVTGGWVNWTLLHAGMLIHQLQTIMKQYMLCNVIYTTIEEPVSKNYGNAAKITIGEIWYTWHQRNHKNGMLQCSFLSHHVSPLWTDEPSKTTIQIIINFILVRKPNPPITKKSHSSDLWYTVHLTHWGRDKMASIFQTTFSNAFSWMKMDEFRLRFHWSSFPRFQLTIFQHRFR